jgi:vacuolar protein sorting-associated protein 13A/C
MPSLPCQKMERLLGTYVHCTFLFVNSYLDSSWMMMFESHFVKVCFDGVSVTFLPPLGAQEKGVEGFFKGLGKGLMGLITKPSGGTVDMVSIAF